MEISQTVRSPNGKGIWRYLFGENAWKFLALAIIKLICLVLHSGEDSVESVLKNLQKGRKHIKPSMLYFCCQLFSPTPSPSPSPSDVF
jgi:hypothetical protein